MLIKPNLSKKLGKVQTLWVSMRYMDVKDEPKSKA